MPSPTGDEILARGMELYNERRFEPALDAFRRARAAGAAGPAPDLFAGHALTSLGRGREAAAAFRAAARRFPRHAPAHLALAAAYRGMGDYSRAFAALKDALDCGAAQAAGLLDGWLSDPKLTPASTRRLAKLFPERAAGLLDRWLSDPKLTPTDARRLAKLFPGQPAAYAASASAHRKLGEFKEALAVLSKGLRLFPDFPALGALLDDILADPAAGARQAARGSERLFPRRAAAYAASASAHRERGRLKEALAVLSRARRLFPDFLAIGALVEESASAHLASSFAYERRGELEKAFAALSEAFRLRLGPERAAGMVDALLAAPEAGAADALKRFQEGSPLAERMPAYLQGALLERVERAAGGDPAAAEAALARLCAISGKGSRSVLKASTSCFAGAGLTEPQRDEVRENGYTLVPRCASPALVDAARRRIDARFAAPADSRSFLGRFGEYRYEFMDDPEILSLLYRTPAWATAEALIGRGRVAGIDRAQVVLRYPEKRDVPRDVGLHIDGLYSEKGPMDLAASSFTLQLCFLLNDWPEPFCGNFAVSPGSHLALAKIVRRGGIPALRKHFSTLRLPEAVQLTGRSGDMILAHYQVAHDGHRNFSQRTRYAVFFRFSHVEHAKRWRRALVEPWLEWKGLSRAGGTSGARL